MVLAVCRLLLTCLDSFSTISLNIECHLLGEHYWSWVRAVACHRTCSDQFPWSNTCAFSIQKQKLISVDILGWHIIRPHGAAYGHEFYTNYMAGT